MENLARSLHERDAGELTESTGVSSTACEARYLGRLVQALASEYGGRPHSPLNSVG